MKITIFPKLPKGAFSSKVEVLSEPIIEANFKVENVDQSFNIVPGIKVKDNGLFRAKYFDKEDRQIDDEIFTLIDFQNFGVNLAQGYDLPVSYLIDAIEIDASDERVILTLL